MQLADDDAGAMLALPSSYVDDKLALVDALPYIDTGYDDAAQALVWLRRANALPSFSLIGTTTY
jgi:hypothetical protein